MMFDHQEQSALDAREQAQRIAFGPSVFQATRVLRDSGVLERIEEAGAAGMTFDDIVASHTLTRYALRVLVEAALGIGLLTTGADRYRTTKTAWFVLHDPMTRVNMDFSHYVNYQGMHSLDIALQESRPAGLGVLGDWATIYQALAMLPARTRSAWLAFDHYYSDLAFQPSLDVLAMAGHKRILDIGGNTGRFARACVERQPSVQVTILDLPGQIAMSRMQLSGAPGLERIDWYPADLLDPQAMLPTGYDAIWMSQFLDCFAEEEIVSVLMRCNSALQDPGRIYILEPFWDLQKQPAAAFCLQQTSLYFAALANGNSRMYTSDVMAGLVRRAGLELLEIVHPVGIVHSMMICRPSQTTQP